MIGTLVATHKLCRIFHPQFVLESQFIILIDVCRLKKAPNLFGSFELRIFQSLPLQFPVFCKQLRIVAREFLQANQEVPQVCLEPEEVTLIEE